MQRVFACTSAPAALKATCPADGMGFWARPRLEAGWSLSEQAGLARVSGRIRRCRPARLVSVIIGHRASKTFGVPVMCRSTLGLAVLALFLSGAQTNGPEGKALALVKKLGGKVHRDDKKEGKPITFVSLSNKQVTDADLKELAGLKQLETLNLTSTQISDSGLKDLTELSQLRCLDLGETRITDVGLSALAGLNQLQTLDLSETQISDAGLKELAGLKQLQWLELEDTRVSDDSLNELAGLKQLEFLSLHGTRVTSKGVAELQKALPKCEIKHGKN